VRTSRRWLTVIAAAGGLLIAGSPAIAAVPAAASTSSQAAQAAVTPLSASPDVTGAQIYLTHANVYGWTTHANNAQLTIDVRPATGFYLTATSNPYFFKIHASSQRCVEAEGNGDTRVILTDCQQGNGNQEWEAVSYNGGCTLQDEANGHYATVYNDASGKPIWESDPPPSGSWVTWSTTLWRGC
jgi:hypothetical protein